ncbi:hypothetical protein V2W45_1470695 [Cenococcum geophilum]
MAYSPLTWFIKANPYGHYYFTHRRQSLAGSLPSPFNILLTYKQYPGVIEIQQVKSIYTGLTIASTSFKTKGVLNSKLAGDYYIHSFLKLLRRQLPETLLYKTVAADKSPSIGQSILTLLDLILSRFRTLYLHSLPINISFIKAYEGFKEALASFLSVYIADLILRHVFHSHTKRPSTPSDNDYLDNNLSRLLFPVSLKLKHFSNKELSAWLLKLSSDPIFSYTYCLIFSTLALILRRIRDKNILPYVYILFAFLSTTILILYLKIVAFLNALLKSKKYKPLSYSKHDKEKRFLKLTLIIKSRTERILRLIQLGYKTNKGFHSLNYTFLLANAIDIDLLSTPL